MQKLIALTLLFSFFTNSIVKGAVTPPNYNFSLKALSFFLPEKPFAKMEQEYGKAELMLEDSQGNIYRFFVAQLRYKFPVYVRIVKGKAVDFHASLPTYFSHDLFHQALINKYGKQNGYLKKENSAIYIWNKTKGMQHTYVGTCSITCFPVYYSVALFPFPEAQVSISDVLRLPKTKNPKP